MPEMAAPPSRHSRMSPGAEAEPTLPGRAARPTETLVDPKGPQFLGPTIDHSKQPAAEAEPVLDELDRSHCQCPGTWPAVHLLPTTRRVSHRVAEALTPVELKTVVGPRPPRHRCLTSALGSLERVSRLRSFHHSRQEEPKAIAQYGRPLASSSPIRAVATTRT